MQYLNGIGILNLVSDWSVRSRVVNTSEYNEGDSCVLQH